MQFKEFYGTKIDWLGKNLDENNFCRLANIRPSSSHIFHEKKK